MTPKLTTPNTPTTLGKTYKATARQRGADQPGPWKIDDALKTSAAIAKAAGGQA